MGLGTSTTIDKIVSHLLSMGLFERVGKHEPKNSPGSGLTAALWSERIVPHPVGSGLNVTAAVNVFMLRIYTNMISEPQDDIDPKMVAAADRIMEELSGDFGLGGVVSNIDLLGEAGSPMSANAGYVTIAQTIYRVIDITIPVIVRDAWSQAT
jgi:hypothetical protein